jgi:hypothetical protein
MLGQSRILGNHQSNTLPSSGAVATRGPQTAQAPGVQQPWLVEMTSLISRAVFPIMGALFQLSPSKPSFNVDIFKLFPTC